MPKPPLFARIAGAILLIAATCEAQQAPRYLIWDTGLLGSVRALYAGMRTEFSGCIYGRGTPDSIVTTFFVPASFDPRTASDSELYMLSCPVVMGTDSSHLVGILHSHMRPGSVCGPSGFPQNAESPGTSPDSLRLDRAVLWWWMHYNGALFSAILCSHGDSLVEFSIDERGVLTGWGAYRLPPLDSLYARKP